MASDPYQRRGTTLPGSALAPAARRSRRLPVSAHDRAHGLSVSSARIQSGWLEFRPWLSSAPPPHVWPKVRSREKIHASIKFCYRRAPLGTLISSISFFQSVCRSPCPPLVPPTAPSSGGHPFMKIVQSSPTPSLYITVARLQPRQTLLFPPTKMLVHRKMISTRDGRPPALPPAHPPSLTQSPPLTWSSASVTCRP